MAKSVKKKAARDGKRSASAGSKMPVKKSGKTTATSRKRKSKKVRKSSTLSKKAVSEKAKPRGRRKKSLAKRSTSVVERKTMRLEDTSVVSQSTNRNEIPEFDLAEEILAEQRKIAGMRRKGPGGRSGPLTPPAGSKPVSYAVERTDPVSSQQQEIIVEIVARDIEKLRANSS